MRITFSTIEAFISELEREWKAGHVWRNQVRYDVVSRAEQKEAVSFEIGLILTAMIDEEGNGEGFLLESVIRCGSDDPSEAVPDAGSKQAQKNLKLVHAAANDCALSVLPGRLEA